MCVFNLVDLKLFLKKSSVGRSIILTYRYIISLPMFYVKALCFYLIKSKISPPDLYEDEELFELLINQRKSLTRFGDGEIQWMFGIAKGYFGQLNNKELSRELNNIILSNNESLIICVPGFFDEMKDYSRNRIISRNAHLFSNYHRWNQVLSRRKYGDALITRVYNGRKNIQQAAFLFEQWKSVFSRRDIIVIEGKDTKFGVGNDLLNDAKSVRRIIGPSENAYERKNDILKAIRELYTEDVLVLLCLGPTATVLSENICRDGFQALDIGHLDIEYEWYIRKSNRKIVIPGKYVNEAGGAPSSFLENKWMIKYKQEIVLELSNVNDKP